LEHPRRIKVDLVSIFFKKDNQKQLPHTVLMGHFFEHIKDRVPTAVEPGINSQFERWDRSHTQKT